MKNNSFACFTRAFFILGYVPDVFILSTTWKDLFCSCADDLSILWQMFNLVFLSLKLWFQCNSRIFRTHFESIMTLNSWEMIAKTRSYNFRCRSPFCEHRVCLSSQIVECSHHCTNPTQDNFWIILSLPSYFRHSVLTSDTTQDQHLLWSFHWLA